MCFFRRINRKWENIRIQSRLRFSLLILVTTTLVVLVGIAILFRFVAGVSLEGSQLVIRLDDDVASRIFSGSDPYSFPNDQQLDNSDDTVFVHDAYVSLPIDILLVATALGFGLIATAWLVWRRFQRCYRN